MAIFSRGLVLLIMLFASSVFSQNILPGTLPDKPVETSADSLLDNLLDEPHYLAAIELHTAAELQTVLERAEQLLDEGVVLQADPAPVAFILHGPEVISLLRQNYRQNKAMVDLAARLSALGVVEIKVCKTWMGGNGVAEENLQPFVSTVVYGASEISRLIQEEDYIYF